MRYLVKLGPIEFEDEPTQTFYLSMGDRGIDHEWGTDDAQAVALLASRGAKEPCCCEPALEAAARTLGLDVGELPEPALALKAAVAVQLDLGPALDPRVEPPLLLELLDALAAFDGAATWEAFEPDEIVTLEVKKPRRTLDASVLGQNDEVYGLAIYDQPGALMRGASEEELQAEPCTSAWLDRRPSFALDAVHALTGLSFSPGAVRLKRGEPVPLGVADLALLIAGLRAVTALAEEGTREAAGRCGEARPKLELRARRLLEGEAVDDAADEALDFEGVGRNDPCPCGSGRKYKQCHLGAKPAAAGPSDNPHQALRDRDSELVVAVLRSQPARNLGQEIFGNREVSEQLVAPLLAWEWPEAGVERFVDQQGAKLSASDREWIAAQRLARTRPYEVLRVERGTGVELVDLLTGERVFVNERSGSQVLVDRDVVLGRVVRTARAAVFGGVHQTPLPPGDAKTLVERARAEGLGDGAWPSTVRLLALWDDAVSDRALKLASPRKVRNTDGHAAVMVHDEYAVEKGAWATVLSRVSGLDGATLDEEGKKKTGITLTRAGNAMFKEWKRTVVASLSLSERKLTVQANSVERADEVRARLEAELGAQLRFRERKAEPLPESRGGEDLILDVQTVDPTETLNLQRSWLDAEHPTLAGRTPRQAVQDEAGREAVHWLLKELENLDARNPRPEAGSSGRQLRRELGLDALGGLDVHRELDRAVGAGRKLSETLLEFAQPVLADAGKTSTRELPRALEFATAVWNLVALEEQSADAGRLADARAALKPGQFPAGLMRHFDLLVRRKREQFAGDLRLGAELRVEQSKQGMGVFVATMLAPALAEKVRAAGLKPPD